MIYTGPCIRGQGSYAVAIVAPYHQQKSPDLHKYCSSSFGVSILELIRLLRGPCGAVVAATAPMIPLTCMTKSTDCKVKT